MISNPTNKQTKNPANIYSLLYNILLYIKNKIRSFSLLTSYSVIYCILYSIYIFRKENFKSYGFKSIKRNYNGHNRCLFMGLVWYSCTTAFQYDNVSTEWLVTIRLLISGIILLIISSFGTRKRDIWHLETKI